jgi:hypothetical protein
MFLSLDCRKLTLGRLGRKEASADGQYVIAVDDRLDEGLN